jgi:hypothetical protein
MSGGARGPRSRENVEAVKRALHLTRVSVRKLSERQVELKKARQIILDQLRAGKPDFQVLAYMNHRRKLSGVQLDQAEKILGSMRADFRRKHGTPRKAKLAPKK